MNNQPFVINDSFWVNPSLGSVQEKISGKQSRIEPRLMQLLCLLADRPGELISRDHITKEIWNNYGNADEGLTQSISYLRKVLNDETKQIIETIPKKGYVLHAIVSSIPDEKQSFKAPNTKRRKTYWVACIIVLIMTVSGYLLIRNRSSSLATPSADMIRTNHK